MVRLHDGAGDGETEARAAVLAGTRPISPVEPVEDVRQVIRVDAAAARSAPSAMALEGWEMVSVLTMRARPASCRRA